MPSDHVSTYRALDAERSVVSFTKWRRYCIAIIFVSIGAIADTTNTIEATGDNDNDTQPPLLLATAIPLPKFKGDLPEYMARYDALRHRPFSDSGFNGVMLPLMPSNSLGACDPREANAFSFLLSMSMDWVPGCYNSRHGYFVFKRTGPSIIGLAQSRDKLGLAELAQDWNATHIIGGVLGKIGSNFVADITIYDRNGVVAHDIAIHEPAPYFTLLGDVMASIIRWRGHEPSQGLLKLLHLPRCKDHQSIVDLGSAAFLPERSQQEFRLYEKILKDDPGFNDVRAWYYNQYGWAVDDWTLFDEQMAVAQRYYPVVECLEMVKPSVLSDMGLEPTFLTTATNLIQELGDNHPLAASLGVKITQIRGRAPSNKEMVSWLSCAENFPNNRNFLVDMADLTFQDNAFSCQDADMAISLLWTTLISDFTPGSPVSAQRQTFRKLADALSELGDSPISLPLREFVMEANSESGNWWWAGRMGELMADDLMSMGYFEEADIQLDEARRLTDKSGYSAAKLIGKRVICNALIGRTSHARTLLHQLSPDDRYFSIFYRALESYINISEGRDLGIEEWVLLADLYPEWRRYYFTLLSSRDLKFKKDDYRSALSEALIYDPMYRPYWILFDAYEEQSTSPDAAYFYESLEWTNPDDPWVRDALSRFKSRSGTFSTNSIATLTQSLSHFEPMSGWLPLNPPDQTKPPSTSLPPFGQIVVALKQVTKEGKFNEAKDLTLRYRNMMWCAVNTKYNTRPGRPETLSSQVYCNHLLHTIDSINASSRHQTQSAIEQKD